MPPTITVTPDPLVHGQSACVSTDGTLPKDIDATITHADGSVTHETIKLVEAKTTWTVPSTAQKVVFHDTSGQCADVTRIVA